MLIKIEVPYGKTSQAAMIGNDITVRIIDPPKIPVAQNPASMLKAAMDNPIGTDLLEKLVSPQDTIAVVVNDHTRPGPNQLIVQELLTRLEKAGVPDGNICFVFATGSHRAPTPAEQADIVGEAVTKKFRLTVHDCEDEQSLFLLGHTLQNVPLYINKVVAEASCVITTGLIAPHHAAGFSGGRKSILPGVAGIKTLHIHHSLPIRPFEPAMGFFEGNPFHEMALEAAKKVNVRFMVNSVQDSHKQDIAFVAGDLEKAHIEGVRMCRQNSQIEIESLADIVVTSPGGSPRDRNLYQAQKALSVAEKMGKPDCVFILIAECADGYGEGVFRQWMEEAKTPQEVVERFRTEGYNVGSNKAFMFARALCSGRVIVVSDKLDATVLRRMMMEHAPSLEQAVQMAKDPKKAQRMIVLPRAVNIIPCLKE